MTEVEEIAATLAADGQTFTLSRSTPGAYEPVTGSVDSAAVQTWTIAGIMGSFKAGVTVYAGTLIKTGDKLATLAADKETPAPNDTLTDAAGVAWSVISVGTVSPAGVALLHKCHIRR